jgi:hypothetical protein
MGGFLLVKRDHDADFKEIERQYRNSLNVFAKKGLPLNKKVSTSEYVIYVFRKYRSNRDNTMLFANGDFIVATGTMFYNGKMGDAALKEIFQDFSIENQEFFSRILGNYCLIISKGNRLFLCNSPSGIYRIYCDQSKKVISTSFLAVYTSLKERNIGIQEFYEYMFDGALYDDKTLIREIELVNAKSILQLSPTLTATPKSMNFKSPDPDSSFDDLVKECAGQLIEYYSYIKANYGDSVCSGLTSGMDTRLMLACMRNVGIKPYLYVYGRQEWLEVKAAKVITAGEGLNLDVEERHKFPVISKDDYANFLEKQYYIVDGLGNDGIFDNGSDLSTRFKRIEKTQLQMNGGGYLLRLFYSLPNRTTSIKSFLKAKHDAGYYSMCHNNHFDVRLYFSNLEEKIKHTLDINRNRLNRKQVETLFFDWRIPYWTAFNHMINEQMADALIPGIDPQFSCLTLNVPYKYMYMGVFQAAVIKLIHPAIAKYPSQYGYNFYDYNNIPLQARIKEFTQFNTPTTLRPYLRAHLWHQWKKGDFPYYLSKEYLDTIFPSRELAISEYIDIDKIIEPKMLSRALSVELLINNKF